ncbi:MAG: sigma-70 family RNA polymerase sigma factor [Saprospiraceae bacterium]|nr:sigma-70 family RNA polymerase sigma factor [Saprospiraceae bacterium]
MGKKNLSDQEIVHLLSGHSKQENHALGQVYARCIKSVSHMVLTNNGTSTDAEDVLQDAIIVFYEKIKSGQFKLRSAISTYIYSVSRIIWLNKLKKNKATIAVPEFWEDASATTNETENMEFYNPDSEAFIEQLFLNVGEDCKRVMIMSLYQRATMEEIAHAMEYKNDQIARNKKTRCLKRLRKVVRETPYYQSIIQNLLS